MTDKPRFDNPIEHSGIRARENSGVHEAVHAAYPMDSASMRSAAGSHHKPLPHSLELHPLSFGSSETPGAANLLNHQFQDLARDWGRFSTDLSTHAPQADLMRDQQNILADLTQLLQALQNPSDNPGQGSHHHHGGDHQHHRHHKHGHRPSPGDVPGDKPPPPADHPPPPPGDHPPPPPGDKPPPPGDHPPPPVSDKIPPLPKDAIDVRAFGARGDGKTDDTKAIQAAIDSLPPSGGTVYLPRGTYMIRAGRSEGNGVHLKDHVTLQMAPDAVMQASPNSDKSGAIVSVDHATDVNVYGGTLIGERAQHKGTEGQWLMGLDIRDSSHVTVIGVTSRDNWGDGFNIGGKGSGSSDVKLIDVTADGNRRNGLSIVAAHNVLVDSSTFINTGGTKPGAGIDIEPNLDCSATNITVSNSLMKGNTGYGISLGAWGGDPSAIDRDNFVLHNTVIGNERGGIHVGRPVNQTVKDNVIEEPSDIALIVNRSISTSTIVHNTINGVTR